MRFKATFGPGKYFIGNPCYCLKDDLYDKWVDEDDCEDGDYGYFAVGSTAFGDGIYEGDNGYKFNVDAGVLGVTNMDYNKEDDLEWLKSNGMIVDAQKLVFTYDDRDYTFSFKVDSDFFTIYTREEE